jgi:hypothetical protein
MGRSFPAAVSGGRFTIPPIVLCMEIVACIDMPLNIKAHLRHWALLLIQVYRLIGGGPSTPARIWIVFLRLLPIIAWTYADVIASAMIMIGIVMYLEYLVSVVSDITKCNRIPVYPDVQQPVGRWGLFDSGSV